MEPLKRVSLVEEVVHGFREVYEFVIERLRTGSDDMLCRAAVEASPGKRNKI